MVGLVHFGIALIAFASLAAAASSYDNTIYLIRHGEKPDDDGVGLSDEGEERAKCLPDVFGPDSSYNIGYILAQAYKPDGSRERPYLTVLPLADELGLTVDISCDRDDPDCVVDAVAEFAKTSDKDVLICWEHKVLTDIADALGADDAPDYPKDSFNLIWTMQDGDLLSTDTSENCPGLDD